jgi:hypothetical protein
MGAADGIEREEEWEAAYGNWRRSLVKERRVGRVRVGNNE